VTAEADSRTWRRIAGPLFVLRAAGQVLEFIGWVLLARRLGTSEFGVLSVAFLLARYAGLVADWGASIGGSREVARDDSNWSMTSALIRRRRTAAIVLGAIFVGSCLVVGRVEMIPAVSVIAMLGLSRDWVAVGRHQGTRAAVPTMVQGAVFIGTAAAFAGPGRPALAVGAGYAAAATASVLLNPVRSRRLDRASDVRLEPWMLGAVMTNQVLSSADTLVLTLFASSATVGIYSAVYRLPNAWMAGVSILAGALLPLTARASAQPERFGRLRRSAFRVSISAAVLLAALTPVITLAVPVVFGPEFAPGQGPVAVLLLATSVATAAAPLHQFFLAQGTDRRYAAILSAAAATLVIAGLVLIPSFGMMGAASATLIAHVVLASLLCFAVLGDR
jgi:O-antigen/teichoic acid export membrane protein